MMVEEREDVEAGEVAGERESCQKMARGGRQW